MTEDVSSIESLRSENALLRAELSQLRRTLAGERAFRDGASTDEARLLRDLLDNAIDGVLAWKPVRDAAGRMVDAECMLANRAAGQVACLDPDHLIGRRMSELLPSNFENGLFEAYVRVVETGVPFAAEYFYDRPPVRGHWRSIKATRVNDGFAVFFADIDARKQAEQALADEQRRREAQAAETIEALQRADRLKDDFLSVVSHELRTPLHVIGGYLRLLIKDRHHPLSDRQRSYVERAERKLRDLTAIVTAVLDFSQLEAGTFRLEPAPA